MAAPRLLSDPQQLSKALADLVEWADTIDGNKRRMREIFGAVPQTADEYIEIIERLRNYPWYNAPEPTNPYERELWQSRAGLLDAVFYEPK